MAERIDSRAVTNLSLIGFAGILVAAHGIVEASFQFYVPEIVIHTLCFMCFIAMFAYLYTEKFQSKHFFRSMIAVYGLVLLLQGIVFPVEGPSATINVLTVVLSLVSYCCLISVDTRWREVKTVKKFILALVLSEIANAGIFVYNIYSIENYIISDRLLALTGTVMRPLIAISFGYCYTARMKMKKEEGTLI